MIKYWVLICLKKKFNRELKVARMILIGKDIECMSDGQRTALNTLFREIEEKIAAVNLLLKEV